MAESEPEEVEVKVAIRRWCDPCFHIADEVVEEGYILGSVLIPHDEVIEVRPVGRDSDGSPVAPACARQVFQLTPPKPPAEPQKRSV